MVAIVDSTIDLVRGVPKILFTANSGQLPGLFGGKVNGIALPDVGDTVKMTLQVKYSAVGPFVEAEEKDFIKTDKICRMTPVEENFGYQITLELLAGSVSANATLDFVITRTSIV